MDEIYLNKTKTTQKEYDEFLKICQKEYGMSENLYTVFYLVFFGFCMVMAFKTGEKLLGIALLMGLAIYMAYKFVRPIKIINKQKNNNKITKNYTNTYKFYKNYFTVENPDGNAQTLYLKIYRVVETNTHFYIYISREVAFIVAKKGFEKGTSEEFSAFIKKKIWNKYRNRIKD